MKKQPLIPILLVVFFALFGYTIPLPIVTPMLLDPSHGILPASTSLEMRNIILGLCLAAYPIGQFFGTPIIGYYSDRFGRRKILILSLIATAFFYALTALSIMRIDLILLIVSRLATGFCEGNVTIALATTADISTTRNKNRNFALTTTFMSIGWILGPIIGAKLADSSVVSWFNYDTPFWFICGLSLLTAIIAQVNFPESRIVTSLSKLNVSDALSSIFTTLKKPQKRKLYLSISLLFFGVFFFFQFWPAFMFTRYQVTTTKLADLIAYGALACVLGQQLFGLVHKNNHLKQALFTSTVLLGISQLILIYHGGSSLALITIPFWGISLGIAWTASTLLVSSISSEKKQGKALGIFQSMLAISTGIPPLISGFIAGSNPAHPLLIGSILVLLSSISFLTVKTDPYKEA